MREILLVVCAIWGACAITTVGIFAIDELAYRRRTQDVDPAVVGAPIDLDDTTPRPARAPAGHALA